VFYNLGEVKFAKGQIDDAAKYYQKAADMDATWGKPLFKLALVELNKLGQIKDTEKEELTKTRAKVIAALEKVVAADPTSQEAAQAKAVIEQLKK
jgi:tetratricopeptide (TPR) repeat protein